MNRHILWMVVLIAAALTACGLSSPDKLYTELGCPRCHGHNLEGNRYGPALSNLETLWDSDQELVTYMRDPKAYVTGHSRLEEQGKEFGLMMLPVKDASDEQLETLAKWLREQG